MYVFFRLIKEGNSFIISYTCMQHTWVRLKSFQSFQDSCTWLQANQGKKKYKKKNMEIIQLQQRRIVNALYTIIVVFP